MALDADAAWPLKWEVSFLLIQADVPSARRLIQALGRVVRFDFGVFSALRFTNYRNRLLSFRRGLQQTARAPIPRRQRTFRPPPVQALRIVCVCSASFAHAAQPFGFHGKIHQAALLGQGVRCSIAPRQSWCSSA
jgi:hypothetical protein